MNIFGNISFSSFTSSIATKDFPIKLITFPTYTKNFKKIRVKLTLRDCNQKHQKPEMDLSKFWKLKKKKNDDLVRLK